MLPFSIAFAQDNMSPAEQLDFGITMPDSKMVEKAIFRGATIGLEQVISSISLLNFSDGKLAERKAVFKIMVNKAGSIKGVSKNGETVLTALTKGYTTSGKSESPLENARLLISKGAKVNETNKEGRTALNVLCDKDILMDLNDRLDFAVLLLQNNADKEFQSNEYMSSEGTPLMNAAGNGYFDLAKLLLEKGAKSNAKNSLGENALMKVINANEVDVPNDEKLRMIQLLVSSGADPKLKNIHGESAFDLAKNEGKSFLLNTPEKSIAKNVATPKQQIVNLPGAGEMKANQALELSLHTGNLEGVKLAVQGGADVNRNFKNGYPLQIASSLLCSKNNLAIATYLTDNGAVVNFKDGYNALEKAVETAAFISGGVMVVKYNQIEHSFSKESAEEESDYKKRYPEFVDLVKFFIKKGAKIDGFLNAKGEGHTPLMKAAANGDLNLVKLLLQNGANVKIKPVADHRGLMLNATCTIYMGMNYGTLLMSESTEKDYEYALKNGYPKEYINQLKSRKMDLKEKQAQWIELFKDYTEITKLLIAKGGDVNVGHGNESGRPVTPLRQARVYHNTPMINALLAAGAKE